MPHIKKNYAVRSGFIQNEEAYTDAVADKFDFRIAGVNHYTWLIKSEYEGKDYGPTIADELRVEASKETDGGGDIGGAKAKFNNTIAYELYKAFGYVNTCVGHSKEYVRFYQGHNVLPESLPSLDLWDHEPRIKRHQDMWDQVDTYINGERPISDYMTEVGPDHATDIIENMVGGLGKQFFINTFNDGAVTNMAEDAS